MCRTSHSRIWVARQPAVDGANITRQLNRIERLVLRGRALEALELLASSVPEFIVSPEAWAAATLQARPGTHRLPAQQIRTA